MDYLLLFNVLSVTFTSRIGNYNYRDYKTRSNWSLLIFKIGQLGTRRRSTLKIRWVLS